MLLAVSKVWAADDKPAIDAIVQPFVKDKPYLAVVVGSTRGGEHLIQGYGQVKLGAEEQTPDGNTLFEIGSITKSFTGTLLADQVLAGHVRLDDPVQQHLPEEYNVPRRDDRDITLLQLATHTSSLPVQPPLIGLFALATKDPANPYAEFQVKHLCDTLAGLKLAQPIGSQFAYSNLGVGLLGHALAAAAKAETYEDLLLSRVLQPLAMADTRIELTDEQAKRLAPGFNAKGEPSSPWTFACLEACGGLRSTAADMLTYIDANLGQPATPLQDAFVMAHDTWREIGRGGESVGLCWMKQQLPPGNRTMIWHNGGTGGYRSFLAFLPRKKIGVIVLSNSPHSVDELGVAILKHLDSD